MPHVTVYSSAPVSLQLGIAFQGLRSLGLRVHVRPLSELPAASRPGLRRASLRQELEDLCVRLATIGDLLSAHQDGRTLLWAGEENGLVAERDALLSRKRAIERSLQGPQEGGPRNG